METLLTFSIAFFFSFVGTIPPGTLNLCIIQLGLENKISIAWRFALAGAIIEYGYAWLAVKFETFITSSSVVQEDFQLITAVVMLSLGIFNVWTSKKPSTLAIRFNASGFRRGILLAILNPMALPFWVVMTAYIKSQQWADLSTGVELHSYLSGASLGGLAMMMLFAYMAKKVVSRFQGNTLLKKIPGFTLLLLGFYALCKYFLKLFKS